MCKHSRHAALHFSLIKVQPELEPGSSNYQSDALTTRALALEQSNIPSFRLSHCAPFLSPEPYFAVRPSTCSHLSSAGQDLCYLCHQRAIKNVPVDVSKERSERERVQDKLLQEYQHQKDLIALTKEQATKTSNRVYNKEMASFNYGKAEKKRVSMSCCFLPCFKVHVVVEE